MNITYYNLFEEFVSDMKLVNINVSLEPKRVEMRFGAGVIFNPEAVSVHHFVFHTLHIYVTVLVKVA